jgi:hypothetical protein
VYYKLILHLQDIFIPCIQSFFILPVHLYINGKEAQKLFKGVQERTKLTVNVVSFINRFLYLIF